MRRASREERDYFERIARQNRALPEDEVPGSLAEMFDRLERIRERELPASVRVRPPA